MLLKVVWMRHLMKLELTCEGLSSLLIITPLEAPISINSWQRTCFYDVVTYIWHFAKCSKSLKTETVFKTEMVKCNMLGNIWLRQVFWRWAREQKIYVITQFACCIVNVRVSGDRIHLAWSVFFPINMTHLISKES